MFRSQNNLCVSYRFRSELSEDELIPNYVYLADNIFFYNVGLTSSTAIAETATQVRRDHGSPTILINNAGVGSVESILEEPEENIRRTLEVNMVSHFWTVKELLPDMVKNYHGHIVSIASMASFAGLNGMADYACTKAGALAFHESLSQEIRHLYGARRIRTRYESLKFFSPMSYANCHQRKS
jgi:short-subunit dehydrogenase